MDFQQLVDGMGMASAVISVEEKTPGTYGDIRIVRANYLYRQIMGEGYHDNMIYSELIPREPNFEDFCYRCAVLKQHLHAYVDTKSLGVWTDGTYIPLSASLDDGNIHYFLFYFEFTTGPESERLSDISIDSATFVIQTCVKLRGSNDFCACMSEVNQDIQEKTDSFCSCIVLLDVERKLSSILCIKFKDDVASVDDFKNDLTPEVIASWQDTVGIHDNFILKDEADMQNLEAVNPLWASSLRNASVKSLILAPLSQGKKLFGYLFVTNFDTQRLVEIKEVIELTSFFVSSEIAKNDLMEKLEYMSNVDILTGLKNRNAMNYRVDLFVSGERTVEAPFGVCFADLNGLKQANDTGGHAVGDKLLQNAAVLITSVFDKEEVYRAGGDEFVIIAPGCPKAVFEEKVEKLTALSCFGSAVCFALGSFWDETGCDLRKAMHLADEAMYLQKKLFYRQHPELKKR
ncbi:MAG: GGDEF domain-containing protein [Treponema sp.]|nr:GGDEF domain-containing protein [Treponema sp.]